MQRYLKNIFVGGVSCISFLTSIANGAYAQNCAAKGMERDGARPRVALLIGNSKYVPNEKPWRLESPGNSVDELGLALVDHGFRVQVCKNLNKSQMEAVVSSYAGELSAMVNAGEDPVSIVYFSGHGQNYANTNYLLPTNQTKYTSRSDVVDKSISVNWIVSTLESAKNSLNVIYLDACRDNELSQGSETGLGEPGFPTRGKYIGFAATFGETAQDTAIFSAALEASFELPGRIDHTFAEAALAVYNGTRRFDPRQYPDARGLLFLPEHRFCMTTCDGGYSEKSKQIFQSRSSQLVTAPGDELRYKLEDVSFRGGGDPLRHAVIDQSDELEAQPVAETQLVTQAFINDDQENELRREGAGVIIVDPRANPEDANLQSILDNAPEGALIRVKRGNYQLEEPLLVRKSVALIGELSPPEEEIRVIQTTLRFQRLYKGRIDGIESPELRNAIRKWQRQNDHPATGVLTELQKRQSFGGRYFQIEAPADQPCMRVNPENPAAQIYIENLTFTSPINSSASCVIIERGSVTLTDNRILGGTVSPTVEITGGLVRLSGNRISSGSEGISLSQLNPVQYATLVDNYITGNKLGIDVRASNNSSVDIVGNEISANLDSGIVVSGDGRTGILGNAIHDNNGSGVVLDKYPEIITVRFNDIYQNSGDGIAIPFGANGVIENNFISRNEGQSIYMREGLDPAISQNLIQNNNVTRRGRRSIE